MKREVTVAKHAGFCFGVKRATDRLEAAIRDRREGERIFTLGNIIHNDVYNSYLRECGVEVLRIDEVERIAAEASEDAPVTLFVRAHGIPKQDEAMLAEISRKNPNFRYVDCTCPFVKKIHNIAAANSGDDKFFLLFGAEEHPEVVGIMSYAECEKRVFATADELEGMISRGELSGLATKRPLWRPKRHKRCPNGKKVRKFSKNYIQTRKFLIQYVVLRN